MNEEEILAAEQEVNKMTVSSQPDVLEVTSLDVPEDTR
jgi:hypothetical protein